MLAKVLLTAACLLGSAVAAPAVAVTSTVTSSSTSSSTSALATSTNPTCPTSNNTIYVATSGDRYLIECYLDRAGGDLKMVNIPTNKIKDCIAACDLDTRCVDISMSGTACYMKSVLKAGLSNKIVRGARLLPAASSSSSSNTLSTSTSSTSASTSSTSSTKTSSLSSSVSSSSSSSTSGTSTRSSSSSSSLSSSSISSSASSSSSTVSSKSTSSSSSTASASATGNVCAGNTAADRTKWCNYDINTNYYDDGPTTGVTVEYWLELSTVTVSPNGVPRTAMAVNGTIPGPTIEANWGDEVIVHVTNNIPNNGSSMHFHGIRHNFTNPMDGVASITQCPLAPGQTQTYKWKATQYGSSWYHSHWAMQAWEGIFGGIVIHGPATANYDHDLGTLFLNDWDSTFTADQLYLQAQKIGAPVQQTALINGLNVNPLDPTQGSRWETTFQSGSSYLIRVVNGAVDTHFDFTIDNHTLQVIASDFVPIVPYTTTSVSIGMGQRYDIIVTANQANVASDFWLRAVPDSSCSAITYGNDVKGIIHYGSSTGTPTTTAHKIAELSCTGEPYASIVPYVKVDASLNAAVSIDDVTAITGFGTRIKWSLGDVSFVADWNEPTALLVLNNETTFEKSYAVTAVPEANSWTQLIIETTFGIPHPIHLHGHDFHVLAAGTGTYANAHPTLNTANPPRRDVTMLPGNGYIVLAFKADNPGVWLAHCHIGWHTEDGFALQFVERYDEIAPLYNSTDMQNTCNAWNAFTSSAGMLQDDSGL